MRSGAAPAHQGYTALLRGLARLATLLACAALLELIAAAFAWRTGVWRYSTSLMLLQWCALTALAGALVGAAAFFGRARLSRAMRSAITLTVLGCLLIFYMASHDLVTAEFGLHDISTDTASPPDFAALLPHRAKAYSFVPKYPGPRAAALQKAAYPDLVPFKLDRPPDAAFALALAVARAMPRWKIVASDPAARRIEVTARSRWLGFISDIVLRVEAEDGGSRIDMRAVSRLRFGDFGINAEHVRLYLAALAAAAH